LYTYIDVPNAIYIGMFPNIPLKRFRQVGNAAGIELTTSKDFQKEFMQVMYLL